MTKVPYSPEHPSSVKTAALFLRRRAGDAEPRDLLRFLDEAKDEPPPAGDERAR